MKIKRTITIQELGEEYVVYDTEESVMHELNETAYSVLKIIEKGEGKTEIVEFLASEYGIDMEVARRDVEDAIKLFYEKGIVE